MALKWRWVGSICDLGTSVVFFKTPSMYDLSVCISVFFHTRRILYVPVACPTTDADGWQICVHISCACAVTFFFFFREALTISL